MERVLKQKKVLLLGMDLLLVLVLLLCRPLSSWMLSWDAECPWLRVGGRCLTCGGTHFVNALLDGRIWEALGHNSFLFLLGLFLIVSWVLLHLDWLGQRAWAKRALKVLYSMPVFYGWVTFLAVFLLVRNWQLLAKLAALIFGSGDGI